MKDELDTVAERRGSDAEAPANRKLIRPTLREQALAMGNAERPQPKRNGERTPLPKKAAPPEQTHAENFYYQKQMQTRTPVVVVTTDGEELRGIIEWYDRTCIKLTRGSGNLLIYKGAIKYIYKEGELDGK